MGGQTSISQPATPAAPTAAQNMQDWIQNYPAMFELQQKYAPQEAAQQVALTQQYAGQMGSALKAANDAMYPETAKIQETLANQAIQGATATQMPEWMRKSYQSDMNANLGSNVGSGIGADYVSRGMQQQLYGQQQQYQNLGLSLAGRQPLTQAGTPNYSNYASTYTPGAVSGTNAQNYGNFANAYSSMYGSNAQAMQYGGVNMGILGRWGGG